MTAQDTAGLVERLARESDPQAIAKLICEALAERDRALTAKDSELAEARAALEAERAHAASLEKRRDYYRVRMEVAERDRDEARGKRKVWHDFCCRVLKHHRAKIAALEEALGPFVDVRAVKNATHIINLKLNDLAPITLVVTRGQFKAGLSVLSREASSNE